MTKLGLGIKAWAIKRLLFGKSLRKSSWWPFGGARHRINAGGTAIHAAMLGTGAGLMYLFDRDRLQRKSSWLPFGGKRREHHRISTGETAMLAAMLGSGAGLMYLLDPDRGSRRRELLKETTMRAVKKTGSAVGETSRDLGDRARGLATKCASLFEHGEVADEVIEERVRAKVERLVSHPDPIGVAVERGRVTLTGPILARDVGHLLSRVSRLRGVHEVNNQLHVHSQAGDVPELQGRRRKQGERFELTGSNWSPRARLLTTMAGGALTGLAVRRHDGWGAGLGLLGLGLVLRGVTNVEIERLLGLGGGRHVVEVQKTVNINAPVERVFESWTNYANFPHFMRNVREVRDLGNGRSRWVAVGPAGVPVEWDAFITRLRPNQVMAWKSEPGSAIKNAGIIRFDPNNEGGTRVNIRLSYTPPAGAGVQEAAKIFGADPRHEVDEDLARMKTMIEAARPARDAARTASDAAMTAP